MKILHTADWHLGRVLCGQRLIDDQEYIIKQILDIAEENQASAVIVAGDVYDRSIPPAEAVELLNDFVNRAIIDLNLHVIIIAGNHDGASRLEFGSGILSSRNLHIICSLGAIKPIVLEHEAAKATIYPIPYCEPVRAREFFNSDEIETHCTAVPAIMDYYCRNLDKSMCNILVTHAFVRGCSESESERPLSIGGADCISPDCFVGFDYVALGHLHGAQKAGHDTVQYSGSPLKYSFSEINHQKGINLLDLDSGGGLSVTKIPLNPKHDVREISGFLDDLIKNDELRTTDYVKVLLQDTKMLLDPMNKLREVFPNVLALERPGLFYPTEVVGTGSQALKKTDLELFAAFYEQTTDSKLDEEQIKILEDAIEIARKRLDGDE